jgi:transcriptional regulator with XRE-family HTH domain
MATSHTTAGASPPARRFPETEAIDSVAVARHFGALLVRERRRADLSQEALGYRAALHRTEISLLERGGRTPRIDTLIKLAGSLECGPEALLAGLSWNAGTVRPGRFYLEGRR